MPLPNGLSVVTLTCGPYTDSAGKACTGAVVIRPSTALVWATTGAVILDTAVRVPLDVTGSGTVVLPATDAVGLTVTGFTYTVEFQLTSATGEKVARYPYLIQLPAAAPTVDLDVLAPAQSSSGVTVALPSVVSVGGLSGAVSASALATVLQPYLGGGGGGGTQFVSVLGKSSGTVAGADVLADTAVAAALAAKADAAATTTALAGKLGTTAQAADSAKIGGVTVTGTPTAGQVPTATSGTAATWQTPAGGGSLPTQTGQSGKFLTTDGSSASWGTVTGAVTSVAGRTGAVTLAEADVTGLVADLAAKAPLASPALTGTPTVPTATPGTNTTQAASTAFVTTAVANQATTDAAAYATQAALAAETSRATTAEGTKAPAARQITAGTGLTGGGDLTADRTLAVAYGTTAGTAAQGNDSRITGAAQKASNLSDVASTSAARTNLGIGGPASNRSLVRPGLLHFGGLPPVMVRPRVAESFFNAGAGNTQAQFRTRYKLTVPGVTSIRLVFFNGYMQRSYMVQSNLGSFALRVGWTDSVGGGGIQVTFNGSRSVNLDQGGFVVSDPITVDDVNRTREYLCTCYLVSTTANFGIPSTNNGGANATGDGYEFGTSLTDKTGGAALANSGTFGANFGPVAIIGQSATPTASAVIIGDSIASGVGDSPSDPFVIGWPSRAFYAAQVPHLLISKNGDIGVQQMGFFTQNSFSSTYSTDNTYQGLQTFLDGASHIVAAHGYNDTWFPTSNVTSLATLQASMLAYWTQCANRGAKVWTVTVSPRTNSSDGWSTVGNQTQYDATLNTRRTNYNDWIRDGAPTSGGVAVAVGTVGALRAGQAGHPLTGYLELADVIETARNSGVFKAGYTADGTHPNSAAITALVSAVTPVISANFTV